MRIVQAWGLDLSLFQFDGELTISSFFMNADKTIYGRYGTRTQQNGSKDVSQEGLKEALRGALELHAGYPDNKKSLAGKTGPKPLFRTPDAVPELRGKPFLKPADGSRGGCVHCHNAPDGTAWSMRAAGKTITDDVLWPYPTTELVGLTLDPLKKATVKGVQAGSAAEKAGFKVGDTIATLEGQPILSIADVQWVLQNAKDGSKVQAGVRRGDGTQELSLELAKGWRRSGDFTWRVITWSMRHRLLGLSPLVHVGPEERKKLGVEEDELALKVEKLPPDWVKEKNPDGRNFKVGDVIVAVDNKKDLRTEAQLLAHLFQTTKPGQPVAITVVRGGKAQKVTLKMP